MSAIGIVLLIIGIIVVLVVVSLIVSYNRFVTQRNLVTESWRQIDVELKRRYDLIPNLIETVKAFATHERQVFESVVQARAQAQQVRSQQGIHAAEQAGAEKNLSGALGRLFAVAENYPTLKSDQNFLGLQNEMTDTEDRIAAGRRFYNGNVRALNTRIEAFPSNLIAGAFKFEKEQYFELDEPAARDAVRADFSSLTGAGPSDQSTYTQQGNQPFVPQSIQQAPQAPPAFGAPQQQFPQSQPMPAQQPAPQQQPYGQQPYGQPPVPNPGQNPGGGQPPQFGQPGQ
ncbi:LemA protein [Antricoccus suffuscus]|uniref:LemA protein n=1 Tax=Antricoccus suffuscus TaxID=1629062 RepID=A0A2T0Z8U2_9ACTN|nr:LemA family protein [Antricoccus suffuscus]PRZ32765.1 LemA protein [Antricoccus suffuscus]